MAKEPRDIIREDILALKAYHVPDSAGMVKLDAMENPYRLPADLQTEVTRLAERAAFNRYPDPSARRLKARLRAAMDVPDGMELVLGNGSDEIIQMLAMAAGRPGAAMLGVEPSFVMFRMIAGFCGMRFVGVPLGTGFALDANAMLAAIQEHSPALTFIAYPNNPTGNLFDTDAILRIVESSPGLVVIDEAYHAFAGASFMPRLGEFSNLLVMRTVSKLGLAGLRLGLLAGPAAWLEHVDKVRLPYNVNVLTQLVAEKVLEHPEVLAEQAAAIRADRTRLAARLGRMHGVEPFPSDANFILFRTAGAPRVFESLAGQGVLVKALHGAHPLLEDCLRVTVGTPEENDRFASALEAALKTKL